MQWRNVENSSFQIQSASCLSHAILRKKEVMQVKPEVIAVSVTMQMQCSAMSDSSAGPVPRDFYETFLKDVKVSSPEVHGHNLTYCPVSCSSNTELMSKFLKRLKYKAIKY